MKASSSVGVRWWEGDGGRVIASASLLAHSNLVAGRACKSLVESPRRARAACTHAVNSVVASPWCNRNTTRDAAAQQRSNPSPPHTTQQNTNELRAERSAGWLPSPSFEWRRQPTFSWGSRCLIMSTDFPLWTVFNNQQILSLCCCEVLSKHQFRFLLVAMPKKG